VLGANEDTVLVSGAELVYGGDGNDNITLIGSVGASVYGGLGNDIITGGNGAQLLFGEAGADTIVGGAGAETIIGGLGTDVMSGSAGRDVFLVGNASSTLTGIDTINDFSVTAGSNDYIVFNGGNDLQAIGGIFAQVDVSLASSLIEAANLAASGNASNADSLIRWFTYQNNTYVVHDVSASNTFVSGVDVIVKLTGTMSLTTGSVVIQGTPLPGG
jgi:Ca2+-binding RTX toxin-like protein